MVSVGDAIRIAITADGTKAISEFKKVGASADQNLKKAESSGKNFSDTLVKAGVATTVAGVAIGAGLFKAAQAASDWDTANRKLANTIQNQPQLAGASTDAFLKQAEALQNVTTSSRITTVTTQSLLGTFGLTQQQILQLTPLVIDLSQKFGIDQVTAAKAAGKAIEGNSQSLRRYGIEVTVGKDATQNFTTVTNGLSKAAGGTGVALGQTFSGQLSILKNKLGETEQKIGKGAIPVIRDLAGIAGHAADVFVKMDDATGGAVGTITAWGAAALIAGGSISFVGGATTKLIGGLGKLAGLFTTDAAAAGVDTEANLALAASEDAVAVGADGAAASTGGAALATGALGVGAAATAGTLAAAAAAAVALGIGAYELGNALPDTKLQGTTAAVDKLAASAGHGGTAVKSGLQDAFKKLIDTNPQLIGQLATANVSTKTLGDTFLATAQKGEKGNKAIGDIVDKLHLSGPAGVDAAKAIALLYPEYEKLVPPVKSAAAAQRDTNKALADGTHAVDLYDAGILKLIGLQQTAAGDQRAAREDYLRVADAIDTAKTDQKGYTDAVKAHGRTSAEAQTAFRKWQEDLLGVGDATDTATQAYIKSAAELANYTIGGKNSARATNDFKFALTQAAAETTGPVHDALEKLIGQLHSIKSPAPVVVSVDATGADIALDGVKSRIAGIPGQLGITVKGPGTGSYQQVPKGTPDKHGRYPGDAGYAGPGRASGGPVSSGMPYMVGEVGPELFVPGQSGTIIPNNRLRAGGVGGGGGQVIHIEHLTVVANSPRDLFDQITRGVNAGHRIPQKAIA